MARRSAGASSSSSSRGSATSSYLPSAATQSAAITIRTRQTLNGATSARSSAAAICRPPPFVSRKIPTHNSSVLSSANGNLGQQRSRMTWQQSWSWTVSSSISQGICTQMYPGSGRMQLPQFMYPQQYSYLTPKTNYSPMSVYDDPTRWSSTASEAMDTSSQWSSSYGYSDDGVTTRNTVAPSRYYRASSRREESWVPSYSSSSTSTRSRRQRQRSAQPPIGHGGKVVVPEKPLHDLRQEGSHMARAPKDVFIYHHLVVPAVVVPAALHPQQQPQQPSADAMTNALPNRGPYSRMEPAVSTRFDQETVPNMTKQATKMRDGVSLSRRWRPLMCSGCYVTC